MDFEQSPAPQKRLKLRSVKLTEGMTPSNFYTPQRVNEFRTAQTMLEARSEALEKEGVLLRNQVAEQMAAEKEAIECALALELYNAVRLLNQQYEKFAGELLENADSLIQHAWKKLLETTPESEIVHRLLQQAREKLDSRAFVEVLYNDTHEEDVSRWIQSQEDSNIFFDDIKFVSSTELRVNCIKLAAKRGGFVIFDFREQEVSVINLISGLLKSTETV